MNDTQEGRDIAARCLILNRQIAPLQAREIREAVDSIRQVYTLPLIRSIER